MIRTHVSPGEMAILVFVAATGHDGYRLETNFESRAHQYLVDDGYLTRETETGMARSYYRYRLTDAGKKALALRQPSRSTDEERNAPERK